MLPILIILLFILNIFNNIFYYNHLYKLNSIKYAI